MSLLRWDAMHDLDPRTSFESALLYAHDTPIGTLALVISLHTGSENHDAHLEHCEPCREDLAALEDVLETEARGAAR